MHRKTRLLSAALAGAAALALGGCQQAAEQPKPVSHTDLTLPVSINAVMVGMVDDGADFLWAIGNGDHPRDDDDWVRVRNRAYEMIVSGKIMQIPGTGSEDATWVADPEWRRLADELTDIGVDALQLAEEKNLEGWDNLGARLIDNCLACHEKFKPELPTQGITRHATPSRSLGKSVFD